MLNVKPPAPELISELHKAKVCLICYQFKNFAWFELSYRSATRNPFKKTYVMFYFVMKPFYITEE